MHVQNQMGENVVVVVVVDDVIIKAIAAVAAGI